MMEGTSEGFGVPVQLRRMIIAATVRRQTMRLVRSLELVLGDALVGEGLCVAAARSPAGPNDLIGRPFVLDEHNIRY